MIIDYRRHIPIIILGFLSLVPIFIWFFMEPISGRFFDFNSSMTSFGQITGLLGMMLFSINLILSNRSIFFDTIFSGLHNFYNVHKWLGTISFSLLLFHPLFLVVKYLAISTNAAALFLIPSGNYSVTLGIIALLGMIILLAVTFYLKIKYHVWRMSHKFMVLVFIFAILHTFFISSDVSRDMFLRFYILFFAFLGLFSGGYRAFFRIFFNKDLKFKIVEIKKLNDLVVEISLAPVGKSINFNPGQFVFIRFMNSVSREPHPFSIASDSSQDIFKVVIKSLGDFTSNLAKITVGDFVKVEGPFGNFFDKSNVRKEIWLAGGVGITPFLSRARSFKNLNYDIDLYYCVNNKVEAVSLDDLINISNNNPKFRVVPWYADEKGRIGAEEVLKLSGDLVDCDIYLCGPPMFMKSLQEQFINKKVDKNNIHFEEFNFL